MLYLILAILSSTLIAVIMRLSESYIHWNLSMLSANYVVCTLFAAALTLPAPRLPPADSVPTVLGLGILAGFLYLSGFILLQWNVAVNGVVFSSTFMKLGVLVPTLVSVLFFMRGLESHR